ncbi:hypothetical protein niasHT_034375 [Heterodera trifolii]|uniref:ANK_REP_REGION domain-containing protein n=1 Tax=Heterodera trifolii TaxID=157864 RepID=A0ABD2HWC9_9BILA
MLLLVDFFVFFLFVLCPSFVIFSISTNGSKNGTADDSESGNIVVDGQRRQNSAVVAAVPSPSAAVPIANRSPVATAFCEANVQTEQQPKATGTQNKEMATDNESEKVKLLFALAKSGGVSRMRAILSGCDADELKRLLAAEENGATLLDVAAQNNKTTVAKLLMEKGAVGPTDSFTIQLITNNKPSPFWVALLKEQTKLVEIMVIRQNKYLICVGLAWRRDRILMNLPLIHDGMEQTIISPLHFAAQKGDLQLCKLLVAKGAEVNQKSEDERGIVPLQIACGSGHLPIVKFFLESAGADIEIIDSDGDTAFMYALLKNKLEIGHFLIASGARTDRTDKNGISPLHYFAKKGDFALCKFLVDNGANVNQTTTSGGDPVTPLLIACAEGHLQLVKLLMDNGANVNQKTSGPGIAPLLFATILGHFPIVKLLIEEGNADIEVADSDGHTALILSLLNGKFEIARYLCDKGARTDRPNNNGITPHRLIDILGISLLFFSASNANSD